MSTLVLFFIEKSRKKRYNGKWKNVVKNTSDT